MFQRETRGRSKNRTPLSSSRPSLPLKNFLNKVLSLGVAVIRVFQITFGSSVIFLKNLIENDYPSKASCEALKDQAMSESIKLNSQLSESFLQRQESFERSPPGDQKEIQKSENQEREVLVKSGFRAIQLVVTDFLSFIPTEFLDLTIQSTMRFGSQHQSLNISLTAIGSGANLFSAYKI